MERTASHLDDLVGQLEPELIELRRDLHRHPEIGNTERRTTDLLVQRLRDAGLSPHVVSSGTGVVCDVGSGDPIVGLRADIDGIAVEEKNDVAFRSQNPGVSHACGHDIHTAAVLGAALALSQAADHLGGTVRCVFEPAEELIPGGAHAVIDDGYMQNMRCMLGLHCDPNIDAGRIGLRVGPLTAAADRVNIQLHSAGGHTARAYLSSDLVYIAGRIVTELPGALTRLVDPRAAINLVFGELQAGSAPNVLPQSAHIGGTLRVMEHDVWDAAPQMVEAVLRSIVEPLKGEFTLDYRRGDPPVVNDEACIANLSAATQAVLGDHGAVNTPQSLGADSFAWYLEHVPGAMARIGVRRSPDVKMDLHSPYFDPDERVIAIASKVLIRAALASIGG